jgi:hypothetical protein
MNTNAATASLGRVPAGGLFDIPLLPLHVRDLKQRNVVFERNPIEIVKRQIVGHGLAKVLSRYIEVS